MVTTSLSAQLGQALKIQQWLATTAESCTGGGVSAAITDIAGSSAWFDRAFITYSNAAKQEMLGVKPETLVQHGAVSEPVVQEMAKGALAHSLATISVAISGIAGPDGGTPDKPVGTVCFAWADTTGWLVAETCHFRGDRQAVRAQAVERALQGLLERLNTLQ
ncbi:nicotinamide-nucleotide amidase [Photobacterium halotolerans]|uniref:Nicotinamide-nucleotide amidase n=1 Tax=Photobacterium halotolerans TaxID=265726 RepID=A0A7X4WMJ4_9GAMM|nr:nicotinamide-nucleotide amidase [Photobacterium halotolerans]NAW66818.1 nicotinamide-nucleotide amidase [Photobacterium halotolerans]NAW85462.1 nicotinamide-nucleotide amidase [Photobacterium halotolerans]NAX47566.1 nicotinamide-nucleotide amidase [Photobacterium halotolerans]